MSYFTNTEIVLTNYFNSNNNAQVFYKAFDNIYGIFNGDCYLKEEMFNIIYLFAKFKVF